MVMCMQDPEAFNEVIGGNVKRIREAHGWTQKEVAALLTEHHGLRWTRDNQAALETGRKVLSLKESLKVAWALDVGLPELLTGEFLEDPAANARFDSYVKLTESRPLKNHSTGASHTAVTLRAASALVAAAEKFGTPAEVIEATAKKLWRRRFENEYKRRVRDVPAEARPWAESALRATVVRGMYAELRNALEES
jgi:transcriptional regulator with XRE-family HTH domain